MQFNTYQYFTGTLQHSNRRAPVSGAGTGTGSGDTLSVYLYRCAHEQLLADPH
jgi:hypothetical protein